MNPLRYYISFSGQDRYNPLAQQRLSSDYGYTSTDAPQTVTSIPQYDPTDTAWEYNPVEGPQVSTADDGYNPDTSHVHNYDPPVTPPYSSEDVSLPLESHEGVDDSNIRDHTKTRQPKSRTDNPKGRKTRKRS
jgi:hypothetical protein